jgi:hypothetical protein
MTTRPVRVARARTRTSGSNLGLGLSVNTTAPRTSNSNLGLTVTTIGLDRWGLTLDPRARASACPRLDEEPALADLGLRSNSRSISGVGRMSPRARTGPRARARTRAQTRPARPAPDWPEADDPEEPA